MKRSPGSAISGAPRAACLPLWVGGKMVARSRAAAPSGKPVLWSVDWQAGHNVGVDYTKEDADMMAFMLWQLGHPDFQPSTGHPPRRR